ncbi:MAG: hypothetical protein FJY29_10810 [Betaproteobacteria bacterium]|nr:hypothetical protein [Betaproteobacteria bacterium]
MSEKNIETTLPFIYQWSFVEWMTSLDARTPLESELCDVVTSESLYRLETYQSSFLSRISSNLSETIFETCENLFGAEVVAKVLAGFFKFHPPTADSITDAPIQLPEHLRATADTKEALLFADVADVCMMRWRILTAEDPHGVSPRGDTPLDAVHLLSPSEYIAPSGKHDLAAAWEAGSEKTSEHLPDSLFNDSAGLLLVKSSPTDLTFVRVPTKLNEFVRALVAGLSIEYATDAFEQSAAADAENCLALLTEFMAKMQAQGLLTQRSP